MFLFSKSIIPEDSKISRRDLEHVYVKRRFKAILKRTDFWAWIGLDTIFMDFCPRRATKSEAYVVPTMKYTTLGLKFYIFSVLSPRICFCFQNQ